MELYVTKEEARKLLIILKNSSTIHKNKDAEALYEDFKNQLDMEV